MTALITLLALCLIIIAVLYAADKLADKWRKPLFYRNKIGSRYAFCAVTDFEVAQRQQRTRVFDGFLVPPRFVVSQTLGVDSNAEGSTEGWLRSDIETNEKLFVPFHTERPMSFAEQEKFFMAPQEPAKFFAEKKAEMLAADWRLRFVEWMRRYGGNVAGLTITATVVGILLLLVIVIVALHNDDVAKNEEVVTIYTTATDGVHTQTLKRKDQRTAPIYSPDLMLEGDKLVRGRVVVIEQLSTSVNRVCIEASEQVLCGDAGHGATHFGDERYSRSIEVTNWYTLKGGEHRNAYANLILTKPEADALVKTGKFHFAN